MVLLLLVGLLSSCNNTAVEPEPVVFEGDVTLNTQAEVDSFAQYRYDVIRGAVRIESLIFGNDPIRDLSGLSSIDTISQVLRIKNTELSTLKGLDQLKHVGIEFEISYNPLLQSLLGLQNLSSVRDLLIGSNDRLSQLEGLRRISTGLRTLWIGSNPSLQSLDGLQLQLDSLSTISLIGNGQLENIDALNNLKQLSGFICIRNASLMSVEGFANLNSLRQLNVEGNVALTDFCPLRGALSSEDFQKQYFRMLGNGYNPTFAEVLGEACRP